MTMSTDLPCDEVLAERRGRLGVITPSHPKALNALNVAMVAELDRILTDWESDEAIEAVLLRSASTRSFWPRATSARPASSPPPRSERHWVANSSASKTASISASTKNADHAFRGRSLAGGLAAHAAMIRRKEAPAS